MRDSACHFPHCLTSGLFTHPAPSAHARSEALRNLPRLESSDFAHFLELASFVTAFARLRQKQLRPEGSEEEQGIRQDGAEAAAAVVASPFAGISATMGWETFHFVHGLWLSQLDVPTRQELFLSLGRPSLPLSRLITVPPPRAVTLSRPSGVTSSSGGCSMLQPRFSRTC